MSSGYQRFEDFWPYYLGEHSDPRTRRWHYLGTLTGLLWLVLALVHSPWWLAVYPLSAYGLAWTSHFFIEHNRPATFRYPLWSLRGDFKMLWMALTGRLDGELRRLALG